MLCKIFKTDKNLAESNERADFAQYDSDSISYDSLAGSGKSKLYPKTKLFRVARKSRPSRGLAQFSSHITIFLPLPPGMKQQKWALNHDIEGFLQSNLMVPLLKIT